MIFRNILHFSLQRSCKKLSYHVSLRSDLFGLQTLEGKMRKKTNEKDNNNNKKKFGKMRFSFSGHFLTFSFFAIFVFCADDSHSKIVWLAFISLCCCCCCFPIFLSIFHSYIVFPFHISGTVRRKHYFA